MPSIDLLFAFLMATGIVAYMPGPATLYTTAQTIARGRRAGWFAALGIHIGGYFHVFAAAVGLAFLFAAVPPLYFALKMAGGAYLVWLGIRMFLTKPDTKVDPTAVVQKSAQRAFRESMLVEILNPKTAIFYVAFLPQFADPHAAFPVSLQLLILGTIVNIMFSSADAICVILADRIAALVRASRVANRMVHRLGGSILVALGINLALDSH